MKWERSTEKASRSASQIGFPSAFIERLEMHVTHACNLRCESCSHYSNHGHKGHVELARAEAWMSSWKGRFDVGEFVLLGGEPSISPDLAGHVLMARSYWPKAEIVIVTNGFFLHRHPDLPRAIASAGNVRVDVSIHHDSPEYIERLKPTHEILENWRELHGIKINLMRSHTLWTRRYSGFGASMLPFDDGDPRRSWEICPAKNCKQLFDGKLWKCAPVAYFNLQLEKYNLSAKWENFRRYEPLEPSCDESDLLKFIGQEEENVCALCSGKPRKFALPNPMNAKATR